MKLLRQIRIIAAILLLAASVGYIVTEILVQDGGCDSAHTPMALAMKAQIIPSMLSVTIGATIFWIIATFIFGRIYCAVCPIGTILDMMVWIRRRTRNRKTGMPRTFRYRKSQRRWQLNILVIYVISLLASISIVCLVIGPWHILTSVVRTLALTGPEALWLKVGYGAIAGVAAGVVSIVVLAVWGLTQGREFCNMVCPIGGALSLPDDRTLYTISFVPDNCISCMKCEEVCPSGCIKVVSRYVDNARCVRCFDCVATCRNDGIRYSRNRHRPASPLMRRSHSPQT